MAEDWQSAARISDALIKTDPKQTYHEIYLHQSVALLKLNDLNGTESAAMRRSTSSVFRAGNSCSDESWKPGAICRPPVSTLPGTSPWTPPAATATTGFSR